MIPASVLAQLCSDLYEPVPPGVFVQVWDKNGIVVGLARVGDTDVLVLRGSATVDDWIRDFQALPEWHPQLGFCHSGFLTGMDDVFAEVRGAVGGRAREGGRGGRAAAGGSPPLLASASLCFF